MDDERVIMLSNRAGDTHSEACSPVTGEAAYNHSNIISRAHSQHLKVIATIITYADRTHEKQESIMNELFAARGLCDFSANKMA